METYNAIENVKAEIEKNVLEKLSATLGQNLEITRNSFAVMQETIRRENQEFLTELKEIVSGNKAEQDRQLDKFEIRIAEIETDVERRMWPKWVMASMIIGMFCMFSFNVLLLLKH